MKWISILNIFLALILSPLLFGIINRVKAVFAGRKGQPFLQLYYDLIKLLHKGAVYSKTTTFIFRFMPLISVACLLIVLLFIPFGTMPAFLSFRGDIFFIVYLLGLVRFFMVLAALDTGSSFEGMGASREVQFAFFAEPALFLALICLAKQTQSISLSSIYAGFSFAEWVHVGPVLGLCAATLFLVFLAENCRVPADDPNTHLELTMIHEVMVLDHSGPDLAFILYSSALKFWALGALFVGILCSANTGSLFLDEVIFFISMLGLAVLVGIVESIMARFRLLKVPQMLISAAALSVLALVLSMR